MSDAASESPPAPRRSSKKRDAILAAATELFTQEGYLNTNMDAVAARAGVSKATVYAHFPSKHTLFGEVLRDYTDYYVKLPQSVIDLPVAEGLATIGQRFIALITRPEALATYRTVVSCVDEFPEMVDAYFAAGPKMVIAAVTDYLQRKCADGLLSIPNPGLVAVLFLHALKGESQGYALLKRDSPHTPEETVQEVVKMILATYGTKT